MQAALAQREARQTKRGRMPASAADTSASQHCCCLCTDVSTAYCVRRQFSLERLTWSFSAYLFPESPRSCLPIQRQSGLRLSVVTRPPACGWKARTLFSRPRPLVAVRPCSRFRFGNVVVYTHTHTHSLSLSPYLSLALCVCLREMD